MFMVSGCAIDRASCIVRADPFHQPFEHFILPEVLGELCPFRGRAEAVERDSVRAYSLPDLIVVQILRPAVVDEDGDHGCRDVEVVVVVVGDGKVPHPTVADSGDSATVSSNGHPVRGLQWLAHVEFGRLDPLAAGWCVDWTNGLWVVNLRTLRDGGDYGRVP